MRRLALERWVRLIPARFDDVENGRRTDYSVRLAERLDDTWPKLDEMPPYVGSELACALAGVNLTDVIPQSGEAGPRRYRG